VSTPLPRIIYSLWLQGLEDAPPLVRFNLKRWSDLNRDYELRVLTRKDAHALLCDLPFAVEALTPQALSDLVRIRLLRSGGVWADPTVLPSRPLRTWLPAAMETGEFFAFSNPGPDRLISSWFLAATSEHSMVHAWDAACRTYWCKPREVITARVAKEDATKHVAPAEGGLADTSPYYWFHYLFAYLVETDTTFAHAWQRCDKRSAKPAIELQRLYLVGEAPDRKALLATARSAPVHKLTWRKEYPLRALRFVSTVGRLPLSRATTPDGG
jgi:hypothetical protein